MELGELLAGLDPELSDEDTARLVSSLLERSVLPAETQAALLERAGGNPLYAEQFVRMLGDAGVSSGGELPETVQALIAARLDSLDPADRALVQEAAVLGLSFTLTGVAAVSGQDPETLEARLRDEIVSQDGIQPLVPVYGAATRVA